MAWSALSRSWSRPSKTMKIDLKLYSIISKITNAPVNSRSLATAPTLGTREPRKSMYKRALRQCCSDWWTRKIGRRGGPSWRNSFGRSTQVSILTGKKRIANWVISKTLPPVKWIFSTSSWHCTPVKTQSTSSGNSESWQIATLAR